MIQLPKHTQSENRARDASSLLLLGGFFTVLATLVLLGTLWTLDRPRPMVVNLLAGGLLLTIGLLTIIAGWRLQRPRSGDQASSGSNEPRQP